MHTHNTHEHKERLARHRSSVRALMTTSTLAITYAGISIVKYMTLSSSSQALSSDIEMWGVHAALSIPLSIALVLYTDWLAATGPLERSEQTHNSSRSDDPEADFNRHETTRW